MRILIAYDGSAAAHAAITGLAQAGLPGAAHALILSVVDAWLPGGECGGDALPRGGRAGRGLAGGGELRVSVQRAVDEQRQAAEKAAAELRRLFSRWAVEADACAGTPAWAIIRRAEGEDGGIDGGTADLVVVGSRGLGAMKRMLLGSVTQKVMHGLRCSLRISRVKAGAALPGGADHPLRLVIGVDGSDDARAALQALASRVWPPGTHILVAAYAQGIVGLEHSHAVGTAATAVWTSDSADPGNPGPVDSWAARVAAEAAAFVRQHCPAAKVSTLVRLGDPKHALVEDAANWGRDKPDAGGGADCIFVGARGVRGVERFLLGSVSSAVAMNAQCTVEIVHPPAP